jgi:hypothetical protein
MSHSRVHSALAEATPQNQRAVPGASVVAVPDSQDVSLAETQPGIIDKRSRSPTPDPMDPPQKRTRLELKPTMDTGFVFTYAFFLGNMVLFCLGKDHICFDINGHNVPLCSVSSDPRIQRSEL